METEHNKQITIRQMRRDELDTLVEWAADEGWNPGLDDADVFWKTDPQAFIAAELKGELAGGGSIVSYDGRYGFMGFFIVRKDLRGQGLGNHLWHARKQRLLARLTSPGTIGMDGVYEMQHYYAKGGFESIGRDIRYEGRGRLSDVQTRAVRLENIPFELIDDYDQRHFPTPRTEFLKRWIKRPGGHAFGLLNENTLTGYAVMRPCRIGHKIGPLFADNATVANDLLSTLLAQIPGEPFFLDTPESNPDAIKLAEHYDMQPVFGCAKMILGPKPVLPDDEIYGITTFEIG